MGARGTAVTVALIAAAALLALAGEATCADPAKPPILWVQRIGGRPLSLPVDIAVDRKGVAFLLDSGNRAIGLFSPKGEFLREIPGRGGWRDPFALSVGADGAIYLADGDSGRILEIDLSGKIRHEYHAGKNARITGVGVFGNSIYGVDNRNDKVVVFRRGEGRPTSWGKKGERPGEFQSPFRLAVDGAGRVFVTDVMNARIQWFSAFGQHLGTLKKFGAGEGKIFRPTGISLDQRGRIWISDSYTGLVQLFEENGNLVQSLAVSEGRPFLFGDPVGIATAADGIWIADQREGRAALFRK